MRRRSRLRSSSEWATPLDDLPTANPPRTTSPFKEVFVGHASGSAIHHDADSLGSSRHDAVAQLLNHRVRNVMPHRIGVAQRLGSVANRLHTIEHSKTEIRDVIDDIFREELVITIELAIVRQMTMHRDQLRDGQPLRSRQRHAVECTPWPRTLVDDVHESCVPDARSGAPVRQICALTLRRGASCPQRVCIVRRANDSAEVSDRFRFRFRRVDACTRRSRGCPRRLGRSRGRRGQVGERRRFGDWD